MQNDKEHLNVDLGFLDKARRPETEMPAASAYKTNWRNIVIIGGLAAALIGWIALSNNPSPSRSVPNTSAPNTYQPSSTRQPSAPAYQPPVVDNSESVTNGQFRCSKFDSSQADLIAPKNEFEITQEDERLKRRSDLLASLKFQIERSGVSSFSDQASIDRYNAMVSRYNAELTTLKSESASHQVRIDIYNQQVQARNNYLLTHCRRAR